MSAGGKSGLSSSVNERFSIASRFIRRFFFGDVIDDHFGEISGFVTADDHESAVLNFGRGRDWRLGITRRGKNWQIADYPG